MKITFNYKAKDTKQKGHKPNLHKYGLVLQAWHFQQKDSDLEMMLGAHFFL